MIGRDEDDRPRHRRSVEQAERRPARPGQRRKDRGPGVEMESDVELFVVLDVAEERLESRIADSVA